MIDDATELHSSVRDESRTGSSTTTCDLDRRRRRHRRTRARVHPRLLGGAPVLGGRRGSHWLLDAPAVVACLQELQTRLRAQGYADTAVPDSKVRVYHRDGAAIEVIWSRLRADGTEIERVAAHFEIARGPEGWRILSIQAEPTSSSSLDAVWPQAN